ncbi:3-deoxy-manno-octulosonate cytidylyltransferase [Thiorhodovibrio frisius]|uniref:CMP-2-keto-3-deoxyoctulosonic acid synthetase n=1 Tax=Thiorhodovibrio frisius TaxID=631362 RepID=H8Z0B6_9GAMM|nr:3-deoxy-manno-octulosonate cytidylyltransferase [Thiorhodovibrio frisius]EIC22324.1 CMP-2-keto-3-deoxyoctulosonic acid synthetase [Thiorhodovibrio frisius]WPL24621.1 3-deoxy-manno-octulosonate cytidylyltransferase [Thiorhodovibrio frisius]
MNIIAIIPARMGSSRFPGKPMALLAGKPMIRHVYERVSRCPLLSKTVVATCDQEIVQYIHSIGGETILTGRHHERASDRCAEALLLMENRDQITYDIVVMVQGDEPMTSPAMIAEAVQAMMDDPDILVANLLGDINSVSEFEDRNCIKVVCDLRGNALYFSREPIPTRGIVEHATMLKQVCVMPFRREFLLKYTEMQPTPLETAESIDMMRVLEHGMSVRMIPTKHQTFSVDTRNDLVNVEKLLNSESD